MVKEYNARIRTVQNKYRLRNYEVADLMGVSEITFYRKMRKPMSEEEQDKIIELMEQYVNGGEK